MRNIGLVLSGGMAKGAYQIGALEAISEVFSISDFTYVSAASVGVLNTYAYLTGNLTKAKDMWTSVNKNGNREWITSMFKSVFLQNSIRDLVADVKIENTFYVPLLNLRSRSVNYFDFSKVPVSEMEDHLRASVAMPIYNQAVKIGDKYFYDGAMVDNIPIYPVLKHSLDYIICIYFDDYNYTFESQYLDNKILKLTFPDNTRLYNSVAVKHDNIMRMIDMGYKHTKQLLGYVFANGIDDLDYIYARIEDLNAVNSKKKLRITGDVVVDNMNKVAQKMTRRKIVMDDK